MSTTIIEFPRLGDFVELLEKYFRNEITAYSVA